MKTIEQIKELMVGKSVIAELADQLRASDEDFVASEKKYLVAVESLRVGLPADASPSLDDFRNACEGDVISAVAYAGYLGFCVNLENFHHPIGVDFVMRDTIDCIKGHLLGSFPINYQNAQVHDAFFKNLPETLHELHDNMREYFTHLECAGPKLAHYAGYIIGNHVLPWVEPGYRMDYCQTMAYTAEIKKYMGTLPL